MSAGHAKPDVPFTAPADLMAEARANCAARHRETDPALAASFEQGGQDQGWGLRHEVYRLRDERGRL